MNDLAWVHFPLIKVRWRNVHSRDTFAAFRCGSRSISSDSCRIKNWFSLETQGIIKSICRRQKASVKIEIAFSLWFPRGTYWKSKRYHMVSFGYISLFGYTSTSGYKKYLIWWFFPTKFNATRCNFSSFLLFLLSTHGSCHILISSSGHLSIWLDFCLNFNSCSQQNALHHLH